MTTSNIYEQPLNETLRICLRLEHLFQQLLHFMQSETMGDNRIALAAILEIVNITERPDLKTKLAKALNNRTLHLSQLQQVPQVNNQKLTEILHQLDHLQNNLHLSPVKLVQTLRDNEFLKNLRLHLAKPGGICNFNYPAYHFWLQQRPEQRLRDLLRWYKELELVQAIINILLNLTRESAKLQPKSAIGGFYQESLDTSIPVQLIRVSLPLERKVFPEISVGRHRLSIHFYSPNFEGRSLHINHDVPFKLACCAI